MNLEPILEFLAQTQPLPTVLGLILILLGFFLIRKRRHTPSYQVQPAIMTIALGVGIGILHPAVLTMSVLPDF